MRTMPGNLEYWPINNPDAPNFLKSGNSFSKYETFGAAPLRQSHQEVTIFMIFDPNYVQNTYKSIHVQLKLHGNKVQR